MKTTVLSCVLASLFLINCPGVSAQGSAKKTAINEKAYPSTFNISKAEFDHLFQLEANKPISNKANKYLYRASLVVNTRSGDMRFLKLKLDYFKNAFLTVQVNGSATTQVFILSDDKSVFYKGRFEKNVSTGSTTKLVMNKCQEGDIVSE